MRLLPGSKQYKRYNGGYKIRRMILPDQLQDIQTSNILSYAQPGSKQYKRTYWNSSNKQVESLVYTGATASASN